MLLVGLEQEGLLSTINYLNDSLTKDYEPHMLAPASHSPASPAVWHTVEHQFETHIWHACPNEG